MSPLFSTEFNFKVTAMNGASAFLFSLGGLCPLSVSAEGLQSKNSWGLGMGGISIQKAYIDIERDNTPMPIITYENKYIRILGPQIEFSLGQYEFTKSSQLTFSTIAKYEFLGYEKSDPTILNGMKDRDGGVWAGFKAEWETSFADIRAEYVAEVSRDSEGNVINVGIEKALDFHDNFILTPHAVVSWFDANYVDYYYGVAESESSNNRTYYKGESGMNVEIGARAGYKFIQKHFVFFDVSVTSLASEIKDSPLIDRSNENSIALGYIYNF